MLLAVLLHLLIFHLLTASDAPSPNTKPRKDTAYKVKQIRQCPEAGYFFKREATANALEPYSCNLCFCQGDHVAVCWKRDNKRCDEESFHYHGVAKKRDKRSPGFTDLFFRDASRDVFNKNTKTQCKPYESSFSDDCPPADWCTGCTVCDCDANGRWDCHLLSFCPDDKKNSKKHKGMPPGFPFPGFVEKTQEKIINSSSDKKPGKQHGTKNNVIVKKQKKTNNKGKKPIQRAGNKKPQPKRFVKKNVPQKAGKKTSPGKMKTPIKYTKVTPKKPNSTKKIIKKNVATRKPVKINKSNKVSLEEILAKQMMQSVMQNLRKTVSSKVKSMSDIARQNAIHVNNQKAKAKTNQAKKNPKNLHKRQIKKPNKKPSMRKPNNWPPMRKPNKKPPLRKPKAPMKKPVFRGKGKPTHKPCTKHTQHIRHKREVTEEVTLEYSATSNTTVTSNATDTTNTMYTTNTMDTTTTNTTVELTVIPINSYPLVSDDGNSSVTVIVNTTYPENPYYKYTIVTEEPAAKLNVAVRDTPTTQFNKTETILNLINDQPNSVSSTTKRHIKNHEENKNINITGVNSEENELNYTKWTNIKIPKDKKFISESKIKHKSLTKLISQIAKNKHKHTQNIKHLDDKNKTDGKKLERKLNYRKYNMVKLIHSKCLYENCNINNTININNQPNKSRGDFYGYIKKLLNNRPKNNTTRRRRKPGVLKYLKGLFNKIFKGKRAPDKMNKHQLIEILCKNFGPCSKINRKDKALLSTKLSDLDKETTKILKSVRIIKGLLKLLELPNSVNNVSKQDHMRNDIQKLNIILKGLYSEKDQLTATQKTQIEYIRRCTQDFIESVTKFASLLNEIIAILTKDDTNNFRNKAKNYFVNKNLSKDNPFQGLKNVLLRFNLVQNTFMKEMYEQLNNFENKINEKTKVSEVKDLNHTIAIENISRNIIHNLRKLKRLAQTVSFRGKGRGRTKRSIGREEDAMEYLLMLMEYLMKQNHHPLDAEPVNDGIDLLIEAIKNAPDIKPIKKKVLDYTPDINPDTSTAASPGMVSTIFEYPEPISDDESLSDSDASDTSNKTISSEDSVKTKQEDNESKLKDIKDFGDIVSDDEKDSEDKFSFDRRVGGDNTDEITEMSFFKRLGAEENMMLDPESTFQTTTYKYTVTPLEMETISYKLESPDDLNVEKTLNMENNNLDKPTDYMEAGTKKIEVFNGDLDEDLFITSTVSTTELESIPTTMPSYFSSQRFQAEKSVTERAREVLEPSFNDNGDQRGRLKWIEENFGKESEKGFVELDETNSTLGITPVTAPSLRAKTIEKPDDIFVTREKGDVNDRVGERDKFGEIEKAAEIEKPVERKKPSEREKAEAGEKKGLPDKKKVSFKFSRSDDESDSSSKKTQAKLSAEEVMFRKQMELLNSLDYGTERAEALETDSKDSNVDEPNTADSFPSYYV